MNFSLFDNQHGVLVPVAVDANGNSNNVTASGLTAASSDVTILTVAQDAGFSSDFDVRAVGADGTATITISGTNAAGTVFSTPFVFVITPPPPPPDLAVSFTATLIDVANN